MIKVVLYMEREQNDTTKLPVIESYLRTAIEDHQIGVVVSTEIEEGGS